MREGNIKVESENILPVIKKWLYSDKDIFLRELVSNGCDAVSKLRRLETLGEAPKDEAKPFVKVRIDKERRLLTVEDIGLGMTEDEVERYISEVAFSGAQEFVERYKDDAAGAGIIGHFGLGFYSVFMVADTVTIDTLSYREGAAPVQWVSEDGSSYRVGESKRASRGTTVTLHLAEGEDEFLEEPRIRELLRKYCAFMPVEIFLNPKDGPVEAAESAKTENGKENGGEENAETKTEEKTDSSLTPVNDPHPLWLKAPKDCTKEEYEKFYSELFFDFEPPLFWIHLNVDYPFNLKGILYFPRQKDKLEVMPGQIKLYSNQVYVADNIKEVIPEFLLLLKGVIDCPDLPLNVSRSFLQNDGTVQKISKHITKKVSDKLHEVFKEDRSRFEGYWDDIAPFIKYGCVKEDGFFDKVRDILLLKTTEKTAEGQAVYKTLAEFPKDDKNRIFYASDEQAQAQYIRLFQAQGVPVAVLAHPIDLHFISFLEYTEKDVHFARVDAELTDTMKEEGTAQADADAIAQRFKEAAGLSDVTVKAESLKSPELPAVLFLSEQSRRFEEMSRMYGGAFGGAPKPELTLTLNLSNAAVRQISSLSDEDAKLVCRQIYDLARLSNRPLEADDMAAFLSRSVELLGRVGK